MKENLKLAYPKAPQPWRKYMSDLFNSGYSVIDTGKGFSVSQRNKVLFEERGSVEKVLAKAVAEGLGDPDKAPAGFKKVASNFPGASPGRTKQGEQGMRERMTRRRVRKPTAKSVLAEIEELEARIAGMDEELEAEADELAEEEKEIAEESTDVSVDIGENQNDKSMDNWPVADREAVAKRLLKMANALLAQDEDDEDEDGDEDEDE